MEVRRQIGDVTRARLHEDSAELLRSNRERIQALRKQLAGLTEARGDAAREARDEVAARLAAVRAQEARSEEPREAERSARGVDRVEISDQAQALARGERTESQRDADGGDDRIRRIAELREHYLSGELDTPERLERAAVRLLGAEPTETE